VLKYFGLFIVSFMLISCSSSRDVVNRGGINDFSSDISEINIYSGSNFRVGVLLPLSGAASKHGKGLKNAAMLALEDIKNPNLVLQFYDTQSSPSGSRIAVENAINQGSSVIIGPLMSSEVQAISEETIYQGIPVIAFSTAQDVLQPTIYSLGLLIEEQVDRIVSYAANQGRKRLALLLPDNSTGIAVAKSAVKSAQKNNIEISVIGFYSPNTSDFSGIIKQMTNYEERHAEVVRLRSELEAKAKSGDKSAMYELKQMETKEGVGDVGFDMVLIPETGAKLTSATSMFAYYDASYPDVQFLGTSVWETRKFNNESVMHKSWFPSISRDKSGYFANKYYNTFGDKPSSLYSFAYDAVALINEISKHDSKDINDVILDSNGYYGITGAFLFNKDGTSRHSLDIVEIRPEGNIIIDSSSGKFVEDFEEETNEITKSPKIFGKDVQSAQIAIFGRLLPEEHQETNPEEENQIYLEN